LLNGRIVDRFDRNMVHIGRNKRQIERINDQIGRNKCENGRINHQHVGSTIKSQDYPLNQLKSFQLCRFQLYIGINNCSSIKKTV
jgi:hypothetical protein